MVDCARDNGCPTNKWVEQLWQDHILPILIGHSHITFHALIKFRKKYHTVSSKKDTEINNNNDNNNTNTDKDTNTDTNTNTYTNQNAKTITITNTNTNTNTTTTTYNND